MTSLSLTLPPDALEAIAQRAAEIIRDQARPTVPDILTPAEAADYMRCSRQRVYDLTSQGRLKVCKDGSRNLYRRGDLDAYLDGGGA